MFAVFYKFYHICMTMSTYIMRHFIIRPFYCIPTNFNRYALLKHRRRGSHERWYADIKVYDANKNINYIAKSHMALVGNSCRWQIYDADGKKRGIVTEKRVSLRTPISLEQKPIDLFIEIDGKKMGKIKSKWAFSKERYEVDFVGWSIEGSLLSRNFTIVDGDVTIANISQESYDAGGRYVVTYTGVQNELIVLLMAISLHTVRLRRNRS